MSSSRCAPTAAITVLMTHADGANAAAGGQHPADVAEPGSETAFDQDHGQRCRAQVPGHFHVVEPQTEPVLADRHTDQQEEQHAGEPDPGRQAGTHDCWPAARGQADHTTARYSCCKLISFPFTCSCPAKVLPVNQ